VCRDGIGGLAVKELLEPFKGQTVGVNFKKATALDQALLRDVTDSSFMIYSEKDNASFVFPYTTIMRITVPNAGLSVICGGVFNATAVGLGIHVNHLIVYQGAAGVGVSF
jgi:hypothetical protein